MKNWLLFTLFLSINIFKIYACGYYPYGEDIRFSLLNSSFIQVKGMDQFFYSSHLYSYNPKKNSTTYLINNDENIDLWFNYFKGKIDKPSIYEAVYSLTELDFKNKNHENKLIKILQTIEHTDAFDYLLFAKKCSRFNGDYSDPWEKKGKSLTSKRNKQIKIALKNASVSTNPELKRRYAYLALRMSYYNSDQTTLHQIYSMYFKNVESMNPIDFWVLHFRIQFETPSARRNVDVSRVFSHSMEKRFPIHQFYDNSFSFEQSISEAINDDERASLHLLYASKKADRALEHLKAFNHLAPNNEQLEFLLLREVNKLEDWILTPHFTLFEPSLYSQSYDVSDKQLLEERLKSDRAYAKELATWMNTVDKKTLTNVDLWLSIKNYIRFIADDTKGLIQDISKNMSIASKEEKVAQFNNMLYSLVFLANKNNSNLMNETVQKTLLRESKLHNYQFLFAIGRELEYKGNTTDAALIYSKINEESDWSEDGGYINFSFWKSDKSIYGIGNSDYFIDYFDYIDAQYTPEQVTNLLLNIENRHEYTDFERWKYSSVKKRTAFIYDLLGTKYMRQDKLEMAQTSFEKVNDSIWKADDSSFKFYLGANPFYTNLYNEHKPTECDTVIYTKLEIVKKLIDYKSKIETKTGDKSAYYCFQVANCYLNMTYNGNSWMMKRYWWSGYTMRTGMEDDDDYLQANIAKKYYLLAEEKSQNRKFAALSLRMAGRCDDLRILNQKREAEYEIDTQNSDPIKNIYFIKLKNKYPDHYEPLISNCHSFTEYYRSISSN